MRRNLTFSILICFILVFSLSGCQKGVNGVEEFKKALEENNIEFTSEEIEGEDSFIRGKREAFAIGEERVFVHQFPNTKRAAAYTGKFDLGGCSIGDCQISWAGYPHFYQKWNIIVQYVGESDEVAAILENILGAEFSGYYAVGNKSHPKSEPPSQAQVTDSPDGKYRAEAYGINTNITAGGLYPYEGIRVVDSGSGDIIWNMEPGYYVVNFVWSQDSRYLGIYYEARIWGESIVFDTIDRKVIQLPGLDAISPNFGDSAKPHDDRPDPYFKIVGWENNDTVAIDFRWSLESGEYFVGAYSFNMKTNHIKALQR